MRIAAFGLSVLVVTLIGIGTLSGPGSANAEPARQQAATRTLPANAFGNPMAAAGNLMAFSSNSANGVNQIVLIDAKSRVISVYHIDGNSGKIELMSVRNVDGDLRMDQFNGVPPLPREIRELLK